MCKLIANFAVLTLATSNVLRGKVEQLLKVKQAVLSSGIMPPLPADPEKAMALAARIVKTAGARPVLLEVYMRGNLANALETIRRLVEKYGDMPNVFVGAGSVDNRLFAGQAIEAGAQFLVSQGYHPDVLTVAAGAVILYIPGTDNCGDMSVAIDDLLHAYPIAVTSEEIESLGVSESAVCITLLKFFSSRGKLAVLDDQLKSYRSEERPVGIIIAGAVKLLDADEAKGEALVSTWAAVDGVVAATASDFVKGDVEANVEAGYQAFAS